MIRIIILALVIITKMFSQEIPDNFTNFGAYIGGAHLGATAVETLPDGFEVEGVLALPNIGVYKGVVISSKNI